MKRRRRKRQLVQRSICAYICKAQLPIRDAAEESRVLFRGSRDTRKETKDEAEIDNDGACTHSY